MTIAGNTLKIDLGPIGGIEMKIPLVFNQTSKLFLLSQAGRCHHHSDRFQKVLLYWMKKNPINKNKAESLETRSKLDNQSIQIHKQE